MCFPALPELASGSVHPLCSVSCLLALSSGEKQRGERRNSMTETSEIWTGEAARYDRTRPTPPPALLDLLTQLIYTPQPALVVDLGSGTGLSTAIWGERAQQVIGIEPNADMRAQAISRIAHHPYAAHISYREGVAHQTGLPDACADIVTCAQSLHWMEPTSTLAEIARILRPGGLFAAYDYDWPPALNWELEQVYQQVDERFDELSEERGLAQNLPRWSKSTHLERMRASSHFRFTRELFLHHVEQGDAARFIEMILTNAYSHQFKLKTITEQEIGFDRLTRAAFQHIGSEPLPWYFSYRVRVGIK
jgi:ubiquinone/menaquinone biosynthesis C-methylase UbiE